MGTPKLLHVASGIYVQYNAALTGTDTVTIDCRAWTAVHSALGNVINNIVHYGDPCFMVFLPGYNTMSIIDTVHTTGKCKVEFYPPYL
jgi:phage-related protein